MRGRTRYVITETLISIGINMALSVGFVFLVFGRQSFVAVKGWHGVVADMAPQTFMIVLMSFLVPAVLTRKRLALRTLPWSEAKSSEVRFRPWLWALSAALLAAAVIVAMSWLLLPLLLPQQVAFRSLAVVKAIFGSALAACVTPWAISRALVSSPDAAVSSDGKCSV